MKKTPLKRKTPLRRRTRLKSKIGLRRAPLRRKKSERWLPSRHMQAATLNKISQETYKKKRLEEKLTARLLEMCRGFCEICGQWPDFRGLAKHEALFRSRGGDPTNPFHCLLICGICHDHVKYPQTGTPLSTEEQFEIARKREEKEGLLRE